MTSLGHSAWSIRSESTQLFMCLKFDCWIPLLFSSETSVITIFLRWWQILWSLWDATKVYHSRGHRAGDDAAQLSYFRTQVQVLVCEQKWTLDIDYWFSPFQKSSLRLPAETELCKQASVCPQHYNKDPVHVWRRPQQRHAGKERVASLHWVGAGGYPLFVTSQGWWLEFSVFRICPPPTKVSWSRWTNALPVSHIQSILFQHSLLYTCRDLSG